MTKNTQLGSAVLNTYEQNISGITHLSRDEVDNRISDIAEASGDTKEKVAAHFNMMASLGLLPTAEQEAADASEQDDN